MEAPTTAAEDPFGLMSPETLLDPYATYARLRREAPVCYSDGWNGWLLTRYRDVLAGFRDERLSSRRSGAYASRLPASVQERLAPLLRSMASWTSYLDAPEHTRLHALISKAFQPRLIEAMRPRIKESAAGLLDRVGASGMMDVIADFARPLPVAVIADLFGLPEGDRVNLRRWSDMIAAFMGAPRPSMDLAEDALTGLLKLQAHFQAQIAERRRRPREDLLSALVAAEEQGSLLDEHELVATCTMLLFGGHETTVNLIGNGVLALLRNPDQWEVLKASPELIPQAGRAHLI